MVNQLWFSTVPLACCKTFAICCTHHVHFCICAKLPKIKFYQTAILAIFTHNFGHSMLPNLLLTHNVKILITNQHIHVHRSDKAKCIQQGVHTSRRLHHRKSGHTV